jgi:hypothetical protein
MNSELFTNLEQILFREDLPSPRATGIDKQEIRSMREALRAGDLDGVFDPTKA